MTTLYLSQGLPIGTLLLSLMGVFFFLIGLMSTADSLAMVASVDCLGKVVVSSTGYVSTYCSSVIASADCLGVVPLSSTISTGVIIGGSLYLISLCFP